ncbi:hypothetical protein AB0K09_18030 [Streptomyces sp. NPDC049577]|uniref:hypothetical protein n=1 Tax=Streptomyces sp. NPDC049577 TaxID=3155153 RepID=UPI003414F353
MSTSALRRIGVTLSAAAVLAGAVGCTAESGRKGDAKGTAGAGRPAADRTPVQALQAAYRKTSAAKSAKVHMKMAVPAVRAGVDTVDVKGVVGWDPTLMDITMDTPGLPDLGPGYSSAIRTLWVGKDMYMQISDWMLQDAPAEMRAKKWVKIDLEAAAKETGNPLLQRQMTAGLNENQDPSRQTALLLDSPNLKRVGEEQVNGGQAQHYKGALTVEEMLKGNRSAGVMTAGDREKLVESAKKAGIKGYDIDLWVNRDDLPTRMVVGVDSARGSTKVTADYTDYGAKAQVQAPPTGETVDLVQLLKDEGGLPGSPKPGAAGL